MAFTGLSDAQSRLRASASPAAGRDQELELLAAEHQLEAMEYDTELRWDGPCEPASALPSKEEVDLYLRELTAMSEAEANGRPCLGWQRAQFEP